MEQGSGGDVSAVSGMERGSETTLFCVYFLNS